MKLKNKVMVVTGGGSGIGRELVLHLLDKGAEVAAIDINEKTLKETKQIATSQISGDLGDVSGKLSLHVLDITNKEKVELFPEKVIETHGKVDGLINNAGIIQPFVKINDLDYDAIERVMNVNFYGVLYMLKSFLPHLLKRPEGYIVNVSSMGGFLPVPGQSIYGASKAAVKLMTEGLHSELADTNVHVSVVFPGATETNISENSGVGGVPEQDEDSKTGMEALPADEAAEDIIEGIEKEKARILVGKDSKMMNFLYRLSPKWATNLITKQMKDLLKE